MKCVHCNKTKGLEKKFVINSFEIYFCNFCKNGFTYPIPKNLSKFYYREYWISPGIIGFIRKRTYKLFQLRRKLIVEKYLSRGDILDVGAGEGVFAQILKNTFQVTSIDTKFANIKNKNVLKVEFLKWITHKKFDAIVFWESLEHVPNPKQYLVKAHKILKKGGMIFIECPNFDCLESILFKKYWYHLDPPRHLSHFTKVGLGNLLKSTGFKDINHLGVLAPEYTVWGLISSIFKIFKIQPEELLKIFNGPSFLIIIPLCIIAISIEIFFWVFGQSPISFAVAKKA